MNRETDTVLLQTIGKFISVQVQLAVTPLLQKIDSQDKIIAQLLDINAKRNEEFDGAISGIASEIARVEKLITDLPKPEVIHGKDCDMDAVKQRVDEYLLIMPTPKDGKDAEVDWDKVTQIVDTKIKELPTPKDGDIGPMGPVGPIGPAGIQGNIGPAGRDGKDGADIVGAVIDRGGCLVVTLSNGITRELGRVVGLDGHDGPPGKDGRDGFSLEDFEVVKTDHRTIKMSFARGELKVEKEFTFPVLIDRGVWRQGDYKEGDVVTYGGSLFIAQCDTSAKPETKDWRLAVKKGVNGSNGAEGPSGKQGPPGRDGRDLTQLGQDGKKWG